MKPSIDELSNDSERRPCATTWLPWILTSAAIAFGAWTIRPNQPIRSGTIAHVQWMEGPGRGGFYTRGSSILSVPGGNGSGNTSTEMVGALYPSHLEISFPSSRDRGVQIIPASQLVGVEFGDAGIPDLSKRASYSTPDHTPSPSSH